MDLKKSMNKLLIKAISPREEYDEEEAVNGKKRTYHRKKLAVEPTGKSRDVGRALRNHFRKKASGLMRGNMEDGLSVKFPVVLGLLTRGRKKKLDEDLDQYDEDDGV